MFLGSGKKELINPADYNNNNTHSCTAALKPENPADFSLPGARFQKVGGAGKSCRSCQEGVIDFQQVFTGEAGNRMFSRSP